MFEKFANFYIQFSREITRLISLIICLIALYIWSEGDSAAVLFFGVVIVLIVYPIILAILSVVSVLIEIMLGFYLIHKQRQRGKKYDNAYNNSGYNYSDYNNDNSYSYDSYSNYDNADDNNDDDYDFKFWSEHEKKYKKYYESDDEHKRYERERKQQEYKQAYQSFKNAYNEYKRNSENDYQRQQQYNQQQRSKNDELKDALKYYGLSIPFTEKQLRDKRRAFMKNAHPDAGGNEKEAEKINMYFDILKKYAS